MLRLANTRGPRSGPPGVSHPSSLPSRIHLQARDSAGPAVPIMEKCRRLSVTDWVKHALHAFMYVYARNQGFFLLPPFFFSFHQHHPTTNFFNNVVGARPGKPPGKPPGRQSPSVASSLHCSQSNAEDGSRHHVIGLERFSFFFWCVLFWSF